MNWRGAMRVRRWAEACAVAGAGGLLVLALATASNVLLRYVWGLPIRGFIELASLAGAVLVACCMPHVLCARGNIAVDFLGRALGGRARSGLNSFGALVTAAFFAVMAWQYVGHARELKEAGQTIPVLRWPAWPWWAAVAALVSATALAGLATFYAPPDEPQ